MIYKIEVDGKEHYVEKNFVEYSREIDNQMREEIILHFLHEEGAESVVIKTTAQEVQELHKVAKEFYCAVLDFEKKWKKLPYDHEWNVDEMAVMLPPLMKLYMMAMNLPIVNYTEDGDFEISDMFARKIMFSRKNETYWTVFDPYCKSNLYDNPVDKCGGLCQGSLADDLADITTDIAAGVGAYLQGLICSAIFEWKELFLRHWGQHAASAFGAMDFLLRDVIHEEWHEL